MNTESKPRHCFATLHGDLADRYVTTLERETDVSVTVVDLATLIADG